MLGRPKSDVATLEHENRRLILQITTLNDTIENLTRINQKHQSDYIELVKVGKNFCMRMLGDEYAKSQIGGMNKLADMSIQDLFKYAIDQFEAKRAEERQLLVDLTDKLKERQNQIEAYEAEISRLMAKQRLKEEYGGTMVEEPAPKAEEKPVQQPKFSPLYQGANSRRMEIIEDEEAEELPEGQVVIPDAVPNPQPRKHERQPSNHGNEKGNRDREGRAVGDRPQGGQQHEVRRDDESRPSRNDPSSQSQPRQNHPQGQQKRHGTSQTTQPRPMPAVVDLSQYMSTLNDVAWQIMLGIGKHGLSEVKELKELIIKGDINEAAFTTALTQLRAMKLINEDKLNTSWRWFYSYDLSDVGKTIYLEKFGEKPIDCEKQILQKEHTSILHGYCIKDVAKLLKEIWGYTETSYDRKANETRLPASEEIYIPDVIARRREADGSITADYFEVELGHHTQQDFDAKCDKMRRLTRDLYIIAPDANTLNRVIQRQLANWILNKGGKEHVKGITVYLTTMTKLKEHQWDATMPF